MSLFACLRNLRLAAALLVLLAVAAIGITACTGTFPHATAPTTSSAEPTPTPPFRQTVLPFTILDGPHGVGVDDAGNVYVGDGCPTVEVCRVRDNQVLKLAAGSNTQTVVPFTGLNRPVGMAVDTAGNLYVTGQGDDRMWKLAPGATSPTALPLTGIKNPAGVAVDSGGNVYVVDNGNSRVLKLAPEASTQTVLGFSGLNIPEAVAVDTGGNVYVTDNGNSRQLKLQVQ